MEGIELDLAKCIQIFKSDRLGVKQHKDGSSALYALAYEVVAVGSDGSVYVGGVETGSIYTKGEVSADCSVLCEVVVGDVEELLLICLSEENVKEDRCILGFYEDLLDYSKKCPGTVFTASAIEYIESQIYDYSKKVRERSDESPKEEEV